MAVSVEIPAHLLNDRLIVEASSGNIETIKELVGGGAEANATNRDGDTAVHLAAYEGHTDALKLLLENPRGVDSLSIKGCEGWTPLRNAIESAAKDPLAAKEIVLEMLKHSTEDIFASGDDEKTPLWVACDLKQSDIATVILGQKKEWLDVDATDGSGYTALHIASKHGLEIVVKKLLELCANPILQSTDKYKTSALHLAAENGHESVTSLLLQSNAPIEILNVAAINEKDEVVQILLQWLKRTEFDGGDREIIINLRDSYENGVLYWLTFNDKQKDSMKALLEGPYNADVENRDEKFGEWTALISACENGSLEVTRLMLQHGADIDAQSADGWTPLMMASYEGHREIVSLLLERNANHEMKTKTGETALRLAAKEISEKHKSIVKELLNRPHINEDLEWLAEMKTYSDFKELIDTITWLGSKQEEHRKELELICMASDRTQSVKIELRQKLQDIAADSKSLESYHEDQQKHWTEVYLEDDRKSWTEVHWAAILNKTNLVRLLLKYQPPSERVLRNVQSLIRTEEERTEDYALTLGLLQNPHLVLGPTLQEEPYGKRLCLGIQRQCCEKFDSTILDFYSDKDGRIDFFRKTTSVWKTIYVEEDEEDQQRQNSDVQGGPEAIMDHAIENLEFLKKLDKRGAKEKGKDAEDLSVPELRFRWVHLPANNMEWMQDLAMRLYRDMDMDDEKWRLLNTFLRHSWTEQHGSTSGRKYMRPTCIKADATEQLGANMKDTLVKATEAKAIDTEDSKTKAAMPQMIVPTGTKKTDSEDCEQADPNINKERSQEDQEENLTCRKAIYMPYLTFGTYKTSVTAQEDRNKLLLKAYSSSEENERDHNENSFTEKPRSSSRVKDDTKPKDDNNAAGGTANGRGKNAILHGSRTLDEFGYYSLINTDDRDKDQVVTRYLEPDRQKGRVNDPGQEWPILRVDQLWLWVIDEKTIITSSTHRLDMAGDPVAESIYNYLRKTKAKPQGQTPPSSVEEMSRIVTNSCIEFISRSTVKSANGELSAREIFANSINAIAVREAALFSKFKGKIKRRLEELQVYEGRAYRDKQSTMKKNLLKMYRRINNEDSDEDVSSKPDSGDQEADYKSISEATDLLVEVKDIRDELDILRTLLIQQKTVWDTLNSESIQRRDVIPESINPRKLVKKPSDGNGPDELLGDINKMDDAAKRIQESINDLLSLEQNEAGISQAQETINQGRTLMVFTIMTVLFLPSSFLTSLFAVDISAFPHQDDHLSWGTRLAFALIFGITAIVCILTFLLAWRAKVRNWIMRSRALFKTAPVPSSVDSSIKKTSTPVDDGRKRAPTTGTVKSTAAKPVIPSSSWRDRLHFATPEKKKGSSKCEV